MRVLAYLDPGSGSMLLQVLLGGIAGIIVSLKMFGRRVFRVLFFWKRREEQPAPSAPSGGGRDSEKEAIRETV